MVRLGKGMIAALIVDKNINLETNIWKNKKKTEYIKTL